MSARTQASRVIDQLAAKARPTKREPKTKAARSWLIICPLCVKEGAGQTTHLMRAPNAKHCSRHRVSYSAYSAAHRASNLRYHHRHRDKILPKMRAYGAEYRKKNRARLTEYNRQWCAENIERVRESKREWWRRNYSKKESVWLEVKRHVEATLPAEVW